MIIKDHAPLVKYLSIRINNWLKRQMPFLFEDTRCDLINMVFKIHTNYAYKERKGLSI